MGGFGGRRRRRGAGDCRTQRALAAALAAARLGRRRRLALLLLLAQIVNHYRDELAANARFNRPLTALYAALGVKLAPRWDLHAYDVRQLGASVDSASRGLITVRASIKNAARQPQPLPLLRVTLQDRFGNRIAARDVAPRSYLPTAVPASSLLASGQRIDAEMGFVDPGANAVGFEIDACLPTSGGVVTCANDATRAEAGERADRTVPARSARDARADGRRDRSPVPHAVPQLRRGAGGLEMLTADTRLWNTPKSRHRMNHEGEPEPRVVQLAGADPQALAEAARVNVDLGAQIIDLNMGCPAKKVCGRFCGSALLTDESLVARILEAVVRAVDVPVTLKIRTGWDREHRNGVNIACIAEQLRHRGARGAWPHARGFLRGDAEYDTIRDIKSRVGDSGLREWRHRYAAKSARGT